MDANRKALAAAYKQRTRQGGIYRILHLPSGRYALEGHGRSKGRGQPVCLLPAYRRLCAGRAACGLAGRRAEGFSL